MRARTLRRVLACAALGALSPAFGATGAAVGAEGASVEGEGRVLVAGGYRWTPNDFFARQAAAAGTPLTGPSAGGPSLLARFSYGAAPWIEVSVDLFGGLERLRLAGDRSLQSVSYGALVGGRAVRCDVGWAGLCLEAGIALGPALVAVSAPSTPPVELMSTALAASAGFHWLLGPRWGLGLDARWLVLRGVAPGLGGLNGGGLFVGLGILHKTARTAIAGSNGPGF